MNNEKYEKILLKQFNEEYYTASQLEYSNSVGVFLSPLEYNEYLKYKEEIALNKDEHFTLLPLKVFNHKCLYYCYGNDLKSIVETYNRLTSLNSSFLNYFKDEFITSRIYSEVEGTLNVENVPTTHKRLKELLENNAVSENKNDIIIKNMKAGIDFVDTLPEFNKENLFELYSLLSKDCLDDEDKLRSDEYYRYDEVEISTYRGCPHQLIDECMDSLFDFVNVTLLNKKDTTLITLLPHICHYYILYIHPYFDYNGRTARLVSYWVYLLCGLTNYPLLISEAINQTKNKYYKAIENSRDSHNDLTYFLKYIFNISNDYFMAYQNIEFLEKVAKNRGYVITFTEFNYMKKILIAYDGVFSYKDFLNMITVTMSKQGALKILNKFIDYGFLLEANSKTKTKLFDINKNNVPYCLKHFGYSSN